MLDELVMVVSACDMGVWLSAPVYMISANMCILLNLKFSMQ